MSHVPVPQVALAAAACGEANADATLDEVRAATERFRDEDVALAEGYAVIPPIYATWRR